MAPNETLLLKSTLEICNKVYTVKLTTTEIYWEATSAARAASGPYSEPLVNALRQDEVNPGRFTGSVAPVGQEALCIVYASDTDSECDVLDTSHLLHLKQHYNVSKRDGRREEMRPLLHESHRQPACASYSPDAENQSVKLSEVITVRLGDHGNNPASPVKTRRSQKASQFQNLEMQSLNPLSFTLWAVSRCSKHRWRHRRVIFSSKDASIVQQWVEKVHHTLASPEHHRPKSLLVFVNPVGGKRKAPKIYEKVSPLFDLAGINTEVIVTQRQYHARDLIMDYDLSKIDGIISVGGDGTFTEVVAGLMTRTMRENGADPPTPSSQLISPDIRLGIIPAGSTDTVSFTTNGVNDPMTAVLHIITGDSLSIDLGTVFHGNQFIKYNVSMMAYGYFGDCIVDGERNRWMGPRRYDWAGLKMWLNNASYEGELSYLPSRDPDSHPRDNTFCKAGCPVCAALNSQDRDIDAGGDTVNGTSKVSSDEYGWQRLKGRFMGLNAFIMACRSRFAEEGPAPSAHLGDGCVDIVIIHECSRTDYGKFLLRTMDKDKDQFELPFVQVIRVREFKFRALSAEDVEDAHEASNVSLEGQQRLRTRGSGTSVWNCDGEILEEPSVEYKTHRQVLKMFSRGIEDEIMENEAACAKCTCFGRT